MINAKIWRLIPLRQMEFRISDIYTDVDKNRARYQVLDNYCAKKGYQILRYARSPGRVNIISEHTDYNGYYVSPIALENDFIFAICQCDGPEECVLEHVLHSCPRDRFNYNLDPVEIAKPNGEWTMYVKAGFHAASVLATKMGLSLPKSYGGKQVMFVGTGNVPLGSGLSSSSALTCCSALAFMSFLGVEIDKTELAAIVAKSESLVAIEGGGMDQAISLNGKKGFISVINFVPKLDVQQLSFIDGVLVACMNSLKDSRKANSAANFYNQRVAECRACCALLIQKHLRLTNPDATYYENYAKGLPSDRKIDMALDVQKLYGLESPSGMLSQIEDLPENATIAELVTLLGYPSFEVILHDLFKTKIAENSLFGVYYDIKDSHKLVLQKRIRHVYSEGYRARQFEHVLRTSIDRNYALATICDLVNDSHTSCDKDYECSCAELNEIVSVSKSAGAFAARLTGAGLGGFAVALIHQQDAQSFMEGMKEYYQYKGYTNMDECCFITGCGQGGCFVKKE